MTVLDKIGEKDDKIRLSDGKNSAWFGFLDGVSLNGQEYVALNEEGTEDVLILKVLSDGKTERFATVDDDGEFERVLSLLEEIFDGDD